MLHATALHDNPPKKKSRRTARPVLAALATCMICALLAAVLVWGISHLYALVKPTKLLAMPAQPSADTPVYIKPDDSCVLLENVPFLSQVEQYPTGCESVSAVMLLQYAGFDLSVDAFVDTYLAIGDAPYAEGDSWYGGDPETAFLGDPRSADGWGCYAPVVAEALDSAMANSAYTAQILYGEPLEVLCADYIDAGSPVLVWATIDMEAPRKSLTWYAPSTGRTITWISPMHCLLLTGYSDNGYIFNDPLIGKNVLYPREAVETAYSGLGMQAVVFDHD